MYRLVKQIPGQLGWDRRERAVSMAMENSHDGRYPVSAAALLPAKVVSCFGDRYTLKKAPPREWEGEGWSQDTSHAGRGLAGGG